MIENTGVMKQGLPETRSTHYQPFARAVALLHALAVFAVGAAPGSAAAQESALVMIADTGGLAQKDARSAFGALLAELRARHPGSDLRADTARAPAEAFVACELARCRASLMLRWNAFALVMVRFVAGATDPVAAPRMLVEAYDAGGQRVGVLSMELHVAEMGSYREGLRDALSALPLPRPTFARLLVTCDVTAARVFLDDRPLGVVPLGVVRVVPGRHRLHVSLPGHAPHVDTIDVPPGGARVDLRLRPSEAP